MDCGYVETILHDCICYDECPWNDDDVELSHTKMVGCPVDKKLQH